MGEIARHDPDPCVGMNCGGGAIEQYRVAYGDAAGVHPKCYLPPFDLHFTIGEWEGALGEATGNYGVIDLIKMGCEHPNCICPEDTCSCIHTDSKGNKSFWGNFKDPNGSAGCISFGRCNIGPDQAQTCCDGCGPEDTSDDGFWLTLNKKDCECRGGTWTTTCAPVPNSREHLEDMIAGHGFQPPLAFGQPNPWAGFPPDRYNGKFKEDCDSCRSQCPEKINTGAGGWVIDEKCYEAGLEGNTNEKRDDGSDALPCCCAGDTPKCKKCPHRCTVWQGTTFNTCGPPVTFNLDARGDGKGYGIHFPFELELICISPSKKGVDEYGNHLGKSGWLRDPPDYGIWKLIVSAFQPDPNNAMVSKLCSQQTFTNTHGVGNLIINDICGKTGALDMEAELTLSESAVSLGCDCACPCDEVVTGVTEQGPCNCDKCAPTLEEGCIDGGTGGDDCDSSCREDGSACPAADALWNSASAEKKKICDCARCTDASCQNGAEVTPGGGQCAADCQIEEECGEDVPCSRPSHIPAGDSIFDYCLDYGDLRNDTSGVAKPEFLGKLKKIVNNKQEPCCNICANSCEDGCSCEAKRCLVGPSTVCGAKVGTYWNDGGHGALKPPTIAANCPTGYTPPCIEGCDYGCGCFPEDQYNDMPIKIKIKTTGDPITAHRTVTETITSRDENDQEQTFQVPTLIGMPEPTSFPKSNCPPVDEICDQSQKSRPTEGCAYTRWPSDTNCTGGVALNPPDYTAGTRTSGNDWSSGPGNSTVFDQPNYGYQCQIKGGSNNGPGAWDFPPKDAGQCLSAHPDGSHWHLRPQFTHPDYWAVWYNVLNGGYTKDGPADMQAECIQHPRASALIGDLGFNHQGMITECNPYCEGYWEIVTGCFRAMELGVCHADGVRGCVNDCHEERCGDGNTNPEDCNDGAGIHVTCPEQSLTNTPLGPQHSDNPLAHKFEASADPWPGHFPFLYYHPPDPMFCPYGEYHPAIGCPKVPGAPSFIATSVTFIDPVGGSQLYYPGNINTQWSSCCGNQPVGCTCCYPCGHPAYDPHCRVKALITGSICDVCFECKCNTTTSMPQGIANQVEKADGCPNGCHDGFGTGACAQVVQDGGNEVAGCGQFMQERPDGECWAPIYCPEGQITFSKYGGGFCIEGDSCCNCLKEKAGWIAPNPNDPHGGLTRFGPVANNWNWRLGSPVEGFTKLSDGSTAGPAWSHLKQYICYLEPCGMGNGGETAIETPEGDVEVVIDQHSLLTSVTMMRKDTVTLVGSTLEFKDHQSMGIITGTTGAGVPIWVTTPLLDGQEKVNLQPGDHVYIGSMTDTQGFQIGSTVKGNTAANGQFYVGRVEGNTFSLWRNGAPVLGNGDFESGDFEEFQEGDGHWFLHSSVDVKYNCDDRGQCAYDFVFFRNQNEINTNSPSGTSPKVLPENLFIECVEEAFAEWTNILENLWSPRHDFEHSQTTKGGYWPDGPPPGSPTPPPPEIVKDPRRGRRIAGRNPFPGINNDQPDPGDGGANSHQLRVKFVNLGHEPMVANQVPSNRIARYNVPECNDYTNYPEVGSCFNYDGVTKEPAFNNMGECIINGHCYEMGCSANDNRPSGIMLNSSNECDTQDNPNYDSNTGLGIEYKDARSCLSAQYGVCLTHPKNEIAVTLKDDGTYESYPIYRFDSTTWQWQLDPRAVIPDILTQECCETVKNPLTNEIGGHWTYVAGEWRPDYGNGQGIWNPGLEEIFPCVPTDPTCCNGPAVFDGSSCRDANGSLYLTPTNERPTGRCCKEKEKCGQCLGDYNLDGSYEVLEGMNPDPDFFGQMKVCDWECCVRQFDKEGNPLNPEAGWCVDSLDNDIVHWNSVDCPMCGGRDGCESGTGGVGCTEQVNSRNNQTSQDGPLYFTPSQRQLAVDIGESDVTFNVTFVYAGTNVGDSPTDTKPLCQPAATAEAPMFQIGDIIRFKSGSDTEYMQITGVNSNTDSLTVQRGISVDSLTSGNSDPVPSPALYSRVGGILSGPWPAGTKIDIWLRQSGDRSSTCNKVANCEDNDGHIICNANTGTGYYAIDNRSKYRDCIEADRRNVSPILCPNAGTDGACWIQGDTGVGSVRGAPIGISTIFQAITSTQTAISITEIHNTGSSFADTDGNEIHEPDKVAVPEPFTLKAGDIIRVGRENMKVTGIRNHARGWDPDVIGRCDSSVDDCPGCKDANGDPIIGPGLFGAPSQNVPECSFENCDGNIVRTACGHFYWYSTDADGTRRNCAGEDLDGIDWEEGYIVRIYEVDVDRAVDGTIANDHEVGKWVRKKYENILCDCHNCQNNLHGSPTPHKWLNSSSTQVAGVGKYAPPGSVWRPAVWYPDFDWQENRWMGTPSVDVPYTGQTGGKCDDWPEKNTCCPRIGQIRVGMVNWWYALRERWAGEGKGQCFDCSTGTLVGGQIEYSANSVDIDGICTKTETLPDGSKTTTEFIATKKECDNHSCTFFSNNCRGYCSNGNLSTAGRIDPITGLLDERQGYTTLETCSANGHSWFSFDFDGYNNKEACDTAGHCWDYREPPIVLASGNPFECGNMGSVTCVKYIQGGYIPCIPEPPYSRANNMISVDPQMEKKDWEGGAACGNPVPMNSCVGYRVFTDGGSYSYPVTAGAGSNHLIDNRTIQAEEDAAFRDGQCVCISTGSEDISGDLYIDASFKWRPDWVPAAAKPGAYSIKRAVMKEIGHMLGLPESNAGIMSPILGPGEDAQQADDILYGQLRELYEPRWWNRGGLNDYWWSSGIFAGEF